MTIKQAHTDKKQTTPESDSSNYSSLYGVPLYKIDLVGFIWPQPIPIFSKLSCQQLYWWGSLNSVIPTIGIAHISIFPTIISLLINSQRWLQSVTIYLSGQFKALNGLHVWNKTKIKHCRRLSHEIKQYNTAVLFQVCITLCNLCEPL